MLGCQADRCQRNTWALTASLVDSTASDADHYCNSLYWAVATMTTTGYGDISATNVQVNIITKCVALSETRNELPEFGLVASSPGFSMLILNIKKKLLGMTLNFGLLCQQESIGVHYNDCVCVLEHVLILYRMMLNLVSFSLHNTGDDLCYMCDGDREAVIWFHPGKHCLHTG